MKFIWQAGGALLFILFRLILLRSQGDSNGIFQVAVAMVWIDINPTGVVIVSTRHIRILKDIAQLLGLKDIPLPLASPSYLGLRFLESMTFKGRFFLIEQGLWKDATMEVLYATDINLKMCCNQTPLLGSIFNFTRLHSL